MLRSKTIPKVLEETPSPFIDEETRREMRQIAVKAAVAVNYRNVGTVEFVVDKKRKFYFLEMNTRLQVEHPITEMVTGIDLAKSQIEIAAGFPLSFRQEDIKPKGFSQRRGKGKRRPGCFSLRGHEDAE